MILGITAKFYAYYMLLVQMTISSDTQGQAFVNLLEVILEQIIEPRVTVPYLGFPSKHLYKLNITFPQSSS